MNIQIFKTRPQDISEKALNVAAVYVRFEDKVLFLKLSPYKDEGGKWGVPAGKMESKETPLDCIKRELFEETGIEIDKELFIEMGSLFMRKPHMDYIYNMFAVELDQSTEVVLSEEHCDYVWIDGDESNSYELMDGAKFALEHYLEFNLFKSTGS